MSTPNASVTATLNAATPAVGGAKRQSRKSRTQSASRKSRSQSPARKSRSQSQSKKSQQARSKSPSQKQSKKSSKSAFQSKKTGGALVDDIKNLAVPFAILLAKEGLENMFKKKADKAEKTAKTASAKKASSTARRRTISGGAACASGCGMTGGRKQQKQTAGNKVAQEFESIAKEINEFLAKH